VRAVRGVRFVCMRADWLHSRGLFACGRSGCDTMRAASWLHSRGLFVCGGLVVMQCAMRCIQTLLCHTFDHGLKGVWREGGLKLQRCKRWVKEWVGEVWAEGWFHHYQRYVQ